MRLLIYLLAMFTGFSVAEAARPVSVIPSSVDTAAERAYVRTAVRVTEKAYVRPIVGASVPQPFIFLGPLFSAFPAIASKTPVVRNDVNLG